MELLIWSHIYSVGIDKVDEQHKNLIKMLNDLHKALTESDDRAAAKPFLDKLLDYTVYHFKSEEELFEKHSYPEIEAHKKIHSQLVQDAMNYVKEYESGSEAINEKLMVFLTDWLKDHILGEDKKFGRFLAESEEEEEYDL